MNIMYMYIYVSFRTQRFKDPTQGERNNTPPTNKQTNREYQNGFKVFPLQNNNSNNISNNATMYMQ